MSWIANWPLRRQLGMAFGVVLAILLLQSGFASSKTVAEQQAADSVTHTYAVIDLATGALNGLVDMETGYRGFLLTGSETFLEPYLAGQQTYQRNLARLEVETADNPPQVARWHELEQRAADWQRTITEPGIALRRTATGGATSMTEVANYVATGAGKQQFDAMRQVFADAVGVERALLVQRDQQSMLSRQWLLIVLVGGTLVALAVGLLTATTVGRTIVEGAGRLADAAQRMARGELGSRVGLARTDELGQAATAFDHMADRLQTTLENERRTAAELLERNAVLAAQQEAIRELSTPILQVREGLLVLPLIGTLDADRAELLTDRLLQRVRSARARVVVLDVTGVPTIDRTSAESVVATVAAARYLGASVLVTGLSAATATTLSMIGVDLTEFHAVGDLEGGLQLAAQLLKPAGVTGRSEATSNDPLRAGRLGA